MSRFTVEMVVTEGGVPLNYQVIDTEMKMIIHTTDDVSEQSASDAYIICDDWNYANSFPLEVACEFDVEAV